MRDARLQTYVRSCFTVWNFLFLQGKYNTFEKEGGRKNKSKSENNTFWGLRVTDAQPRFIYKDVMQNET